MTAVEWLIEELKKVHHPTEAMIMYAKKLEKQQIIDAYSSGSNDRLRNTINDYYNETYGSKGSDETKTNNMKIGTSSLMDSHLVDFSNKNAHLIKSNSTTSSQTLKENHIVDTNEMVSSQTEISDEEIEDRAAEWMEEDWDVKTYYEAFIDGASWYREQLKQRQ